ncbi:glycosyl transferase family 1, partial [Bacillus sp. AFS094228]
LTTTLRGWLTNSELQHQWHKAALTARDSLQRWDTTAATVFEALQRPPT